MEPKYIVAIVALGVFLILFLVFFVLLARRRKTEAKLQAWLQEVYSDKNLIKLDYEDVAGDEIAQTADRTVRQAGDIDYVTRDESEEVQSSEDAYAKIEAEGIEEITGNYNPEQ